MLMNPADAHDDLPHFPCTLYLIFVSYHHLRPDTADLVANPPSNLVAVLSDPGSLIRPNDFYCTVSGHL